MGIEHSLQFAFVFESLDSLDDLTAFKDQHCRYCRDAILHGKLHVLADIYFANNSFAIVVGCQLVNDWTQSLTRWSAI